MRGVKVNAITRESTTGHPEHGVRTQAVMACTQIVLFLFTLVNRQKSFDTLSKNPPTPQMNTLRLKRETPSFKKIESSCQRLGPSKSQEAVHGAHVHR